MIGSGTGPPRAGTADTDAGPDLGEGPPVVGLPQGEHNRQRPTPPVTRQMDLAGQPAAGPAEPFFRLCRSIILNAVVDPLFPFLTFAGL